MRLPLLPTLLCACSALLTACGTPGAPQPPTLNLPRPVSDLTGERHGNTVTLRWTTPAQSTDKLPLRGDIRMTLCRKAAATQCTPIPGTTLTPGAPATYDDLLPPLLTSASQRLIEYRLIAANSRGRSAGESNPLLIVGGEAPLGVTALTAAVIERGVLLHWHQQSDPTHQVTYVLRRETIVAAPTPPGIPPPPKLQRLVLNPISGKDPTIDPGVALDQTVRSGDTYRYTVERVEHVEIAGQPYDVGGFVSDPVIVEVRDTFPPKTPANLAAVGTQDSNTPGSSAIDLSWSANTESDFAGYFLYRREAAATPASATRLNSRPTPAPAYHDAGVLSGHRYAYSVSAIDQTGNESPRSAEVEETAP